MKLLKGVWAWIVAFFVWVRNCFRMKRFLPFDSVVLPSGVMYRVAPWGSWYRVTPRVVGKKTKRIPRLSGRF